MSDRLKEVAYDCLRQMYDEAEPGLDFDEVLENPDSVEDDWFLNHTLDSDRQKEIVEQHCDEADLTDDERVSVHWTAILNYGPSSGEA